MLSLDLGAFEKLVAVFVSSTAKDRIPTEEEIRMCAENVRKFNPVPDDLYQQALRNIHTRMSVAMDTGVAVVDAATYKSWLPGRKAEIDPFYWDRFSRYLETGKGWNPRVISTLGGVADDILDFCGDPENQVPWQRRGLVLGDVQSGKTATYTALCNKAVDAGYRVIIILGGIMENLRQQTQKRLDTDFVGQDSKALSRQEIAATIPVGVGKIDFRRKAATFTSSGKDFSAAYLMNNNMRIKDYSEPVLFVVKKNKRILNNLAAWLKAHNAGTDGTINLPLLLIDDEADNASVNTKQDESPTAINEAIRKLLALFKRASYVGVTATPFANIFINPDSQAEMLGDDLFPRDFIYSLSPPTNYIGCNAIYGEEPTHDSTLQFIDDADAFFPPRHKSHDTVDGLPGTLYDALNFFLVANVVRDIRRHDKTHRSMLINVSRFTAIQDQVSEHVRAWLDKVQQDVRNYAGLSPERACLLPSIRALKSLWDLNDFTAVTGVNWKEVQQAYLHNAIAPIDVRSVNQRTGAASLDYDAHKDSGLRVIAVGGNSLSRGLTLEGLCVSYFYRNSQAYDTLMQMGRWFGYRDGYEDLCRVWMTKDAANWYSHITLASNELRSEIRRMNRLSMTPHEFGLQVREHPDALIVTARNKLRNAESWERWISVSGRLLETPRLRNSAEIFAANTNVTSAFVSTLDRIGRKVSSRRNEHLWTDVPREAVVEFLKSFSVHPLHMAFQSSEVAEFIEQAPSLGLWDVVVPGGAGNPVELGGLVCKPERRNIDVNRSSQSITISGKSARVGSRGCTKAGLDATTIRELEEHYARTEDAGKNPPDQLYLTPNRKPLLLVHIVEPSSDEGLSERLSGKPLVALGVGFPRMDDTRQSLKIRYAINKIKMREIMEFLEGEEDDDVPIDE